MAAVIELLHTATLVHDDVVDSSAVRRGNASVNSIWTNSHSVLIGDYIYSKAFMMMVGLDNMKILEELSDVAYVLQLVLLSLGFSFSFIEEFALSFMETFFYIRFLLENERNDFKKNKDS